MKKVVAVVKLQIPAGKATPAPPVGPALGQHGVNIMEFCKSYNEKTARQAGTIVPVEITVFADRTFTFVTKTPPASVLLKKAAGLEKGSGEPNKKKLGKVTRRQIQEIAETKLADLNTKDLEAAMRSDSLMHRRLSDAGHRLYLEPAATVDHVNVSSLRWAMVERFTAGRSFGALRAHTWSRTRRAAYVAGAPLIPVVRARRIVRARVGLFLPEATPERLEALRRFREDLKQFLGKEE